MRIILLLLSVTYRFPDRSIVIPSGLVKVEIKPGPSSDPLIPAWPAIVETVYPDESGVNIRIIRLTVSHTYRFPDRSFIIPFGSLKLELNPGPSVNAPTPSCPAIVDTRMEGGRSVRYAERIILSHGIYSFPDWLKYIKYGLLINALEPVPSIDPYCPGYPSTVVTVYPEESGVSIRIALFWSPTYKFPDKSTASPQFNFLNWAVELGPSRYPRLDDRIVDTLKFPDPSGVNIRIELIPSFPERPLISVIYKLFIESIVIFCGKKNVAVDPGPSTDPWSLGIPAIVETI